MKKIFLLVAIVATLCLTGCGSLGDKEIRENFIKDIEGFKIISYGRNIKTNKQRW